MFQEILTKTYYGNTVQEWLIAFSIILGVAIVGKLLYWITSKIIKSFTTKTKSKIDDIIIDMVEEPLVFAMILAGIWFSLGMLNFTEGIRTFIDNGFQFLIVINITWLLSRLFQALYEEYMVPLAEKSKTHVDDQIFPILRQGVKGIIWALGIIVALNNAGYNVGAILAGLGIGGLALAYAAKDTVANIFGGVSIFTEKLFKVKDRIKIDGIDGKVEEIGLRSTKIRQLDGRLVTMPNATFTNNPVENISSEPSRKITTNLGISCDTSPKNIQKAMDIVKSILDKNKDVLKDKYIGFNEFGNFSFNLLVIYYIKSGADILGTQTEVNMLILNEFNKNKIEMPFPTQMILNKKV